jgi:hypothetical protein
MKSLYGKLFKLWFFLRALGLKLLVQLLDAHAPTAARTNASRCILLPFKNILPDYIASATVHYMPDTLLLIYLQFFQPKELDKSEIMIDRLKDQLKFYSPLVNRFERPDYRMKRLSDPKGIVMDIIEQENVENDYKIMAEQKFMTFLRQILTGNLTGWNSWLDIHDEFLRLVSADFKKLQEKYNTILNE